MGGIIERAVGLPAGHTFGVNRTDQPALAIKEAQLEEGLRRSRRHWSGNMCMDYWAYIANSHSFISVFWAHPQHPFSRKRRIIVLLCAVCLTACAAAASVLIVKHLEDIKDRVVDYSRSTAAAELLPEMSFTVNLSVFLVIPVVLVTSLMGGFSRCSCYRKTRLKSCCLFVANTGFLMGVGISMAALVATLCMLSDDLDTKWSWKYWVYFATNKVMFWGVELLIVSAQFLIGFYRERAALHKKHERERKLLDTDTECGELEVVEAKEATSSPPNVAVRLPETLLVLYKRLTTRGTQEAPASHRLASRERP